MYISFDRLQCNFPHGMPISAYTVSVAIKDKQPGKSADYNIYDSRCQSCDEESGETGTRVSVNHLLNPS